MNTRPPLQAVADAYARRHCCSKCGHHGYRYGEGWCPCQDIVSTQSEQPKLDAFQRWASISNVFRPSGIFIRDLFP